MECHKVKKNTPAYKQQAHEYSQKYRAIPKHQFRAAEVNRAWRKLHGEEFSKRHKVEYRAKALARYHTYKKDPNWLAIRNAKRQEYTKHKLEKLKKDPKKYAEYLEVRRAKDAESYAKRYAKLKKDPIKYQEFLKTQQIRNAQNYEKIKADPIRLEKLRAEARKQAKKERATLRGKLDYNLRRDIWQALKGKKSRHKWQELVGWTVDDYIRHLEAQFTPEMSWKNYGTYWEVDHIKPKSSFHYDSPNDKEFKECWALRNLQPLSKKENRKKSNKLSRWDIMEKVANLPRN